MNGWYDEWIDGMKGGSQSLGACYHEFILKLLEEKESGFEVEVNWIRTSFDLSFEVSVGNVILHVKALKSLRLKHYLLLQVIIAESFSISIVKHSIDPQVQLLHELLVLHLEHAISLQYNSSAAQVS